MPDDFTCQRKIVDVNGLNMVIKIQLKGFYAVVGICNICRNAPYFVLLFCLMPDDFILNNTRQFYFCSQVFKAGLALTFG